MSLNLSLGETIMKTLLLALLSTFISQISTADDFILYSAQAARIVRKDACAKLAVKSTVSQMINELKDSGSDLPEHIRIDDIYVVRKNDTYSVTAENSASFVVKTRLSIDAQGKVKCVLTSVASEVKIETL
jgi:hypothetical protein